MEVLEKVSGGKGKYNFWFALTGTGSLEALAKSALSFGRYQQLLRHLREFLILKYIE
jgi:hypothetical protein